MRRDVLLLAEMIDAAEQAQHLVDGVTVEDLQDDRQRRDALLWNFTVLGEAAGQLSERSRLASPGSAGNSRYGCGTGLSMVIGRLTCRFCIPPPVSNFPLSPRICDGR
jgi:hypothetical protein